MVEWIGTFLTNDIVEHSFYETGVDLNAVAIYPYYWATDGTLDTPPADVDDEYAFMDNPARLSGVSDVYAFRICPLKAGTYAISATWTVSAASRRRIFMFQVFGPSGENVLYTSAFSFYDEDGDIRLLLQKTTGGIANKENPR